MIDITTAATIRPEILDVTYSSFKENLFGDYPCRVFINIDPIGDTDTYTQDDIEAVARKHFKDITVNKPKNPGFPVALKWLWSQVQNELFFNLEDDWKLTAPVNFTHMLNVMKKYPKLAVLTLAKGESDDFTAQFSHSGKKPRGIWNGEYYEVPGRRYSGLPSLIKRDFIKGLIPHMKPDWNHECMERYLWKHEEPCVRNWNYGGYTEPNIRPCLVDNIGIPWRKKRKISKKVTKRSLGWNWSKND